MYEIKNKIREIALAPVKEEKFQDNVDLYFYNLCVKAFNLGIQIAADNALLKTRHYDAIKDEITLEMSEDIYWEDHPEDQKLPSLQVEIDKESILKLLIK